MNFRSLQDLVQQTSQGICKLPRDIELVIGIPRSGMLPATVIALMMNKPLIDLEAFLHNIEPGHGLTRKIDTVDGGFTNLRRVLVVDDSIRSGRNLEQVKKRLAETYPDLEPIYVSVFADEESRLLVDFYFALCPYPRVYEWNLMNSPMCESFHFDLDGIFCTDPTSDENDDGARYIEFLNSTPPFHLTKHKIRAVVTSRLEKYRAETEAWLARHGIKYEKLYMLDGVSAAERRERALHPLFKAKIYRADYGAKLFIESNSSQAADIAKLSGKPVLDFSRMALIHPSAISLISATQKFGAVQHKLIGRLRGMPALMHKIL